MSRYVLKVGIAYGSDTRLACDLLLKCAQASEWVVADPAPSATFVSFGDSALLLELRTYMATRDHVLALIDDMHRRVDEAFRAAGIEIAFPQLDLHVRSDDTRAPGGPGGSEG
jgi:potassium efflux system protein